MANMLHTVIAIPPSMLCAADNPAKGNTLARNVPLTISTIVHAPLSSHATKIPADVLRDTPVIAFDARGGAPRSLFKMTSLNAIKNPAPLSDDREEHESVLPPSAEGVTLIVLVTT